MNQDRPEFPDLTQALRVWAKRHNVRPVDFMRAMGWAYSHSWAILKGKQKFSHEAHGKFIMAYGLSALGEIYKIAKVNPEPMETANAEH